MPARTVTVRLYDIEWDTESDDEGAPPVLPNEVRVQVEVSPGDSQEAVMERAIDQATDRLGFCILGAKGEVVGGDMSPP